MYKTIPWRETDLEDILPDFDVCFNFIDKARDGNGICLVHCSDGVSRSGAIAIAYIMKTKQISLKVRSRPQQLTQCHLSLHAGG